jgi:phosphatidylinositol alpha-1,6-mannosyltransferase
VKLVALSNRIVGLFPDLLGRGGIQETGRQTVSALCRIFENRGRTTHFMGLNDPRGRQSLLIGNQTIRLEGFARSKFRFVSYCIAQARKNPQFVLAAHPNLAAVAIVIRFFSPSTKIIVMSHGIEIWERMPIHRHRALLSCDIVIATSKYNVQKLIHLQKIPARKIRLVPWPLSPTTLQLADANVELPVPNTFPRGRVILTVGRWSANERYKGADQLIRAVAELRRALPDVQLVVVGNGDDLPRLKQIATDLAVNEATHFLGDLSREELAGCYKSAELFAMPSTGEGFGLVFLEAMAFRKPIVGVAAGGSVDLLIDGVNALVVRPHDSFALVSALEKLLRDKTLADQLGHRGGEIVRDKYRFDGFEHNLKRILVECGLGAKKTRSRRSLL